MRFLIEHFRAVLQSVLGLWARSSDLINGRPGETASGSIKRNGPAPQLEIKLPKETKRYRLRTHVKALGCSEDVTRNVVTNSLLLTLKTVQRSATTPEMSSYPPIALFNSF